MNETELKRLEELGIDPSKVIDLSVNLSSESEANIDISK